MITQVIESNNRRLVHLEMKIKQTKLAEKGEIIVVVFVLRSIHGSVPPQQRHYGLGRETMLRFQESRFETIFCREAHVSHVPHSQQE